MELSVRSADSKQLYSWYQQNKRDLPWRAHKDPYKIWISEIMLQQTTVQAVIPYYERFLKKFPTLQSLAKSTEKDVLAMWSGLGYYSRARNLRKSAQLLAKKSFPKSYAELIEYPGFGPYTSRAVTSIAFGEPVGLLDGNVIRVLSRRWNLDLDWWKTAERNHLQNLADQLAQKFQHGSQSGEINQALMELGATICTPQSPSCLLCPWMKACEGRENDRLKELPRPKPKKRIEIWQWQPQLYKKKKQVALIQNDYAPFLKGQWLLPGKVVKLKEKPKQFHFKHTVTHHQIFVTFPKSAKKEMTQRDQKRAVWIHPHQLTEYNPTSLVKKALEMQLKER